VNNLSLLVAIALAGVMGTITYLELHDLRDKVGANEERLTAVEEAFRRADQIGSAALRRHEEKAIGRAHPETGAISCPVCPVCPEGAR
jgi:hypothetical protein